MNISTDFNDETPLQQKPSGAYEWWYFDALSNDKNWGIVAIFYEGNPFSPKYIEAIESVNATPGNYPAVSISIYNNKYTEYYSFKEYTANDFSFNESKNEWIIGDCKFRKTEEPDRVRYELEFDQQLESGFNLVGKLEFSSPKYSIKGIEQNDAADEHFWNLLQPYAKVEGNLDLIGKSKVHKLKFDGRGYHDHNVGLAPMKDDFKDWYWGRFHFEESTLIYYIMNQNDSQQYKAWLIPQSEGEAIQELTQIDLAEEEWSPFGIRSSRVLKLSSKDSQVHIQQGNCVDSGPFYQRFISDAVLHQGNKLQSSSGFTEYIKPSRIYNKVFWPAVRMRLQFMSGKTHWVQKSKLFYPWTW